jgi:uncharacterized membrane protein YhaH (DUF805 family)
MLAMLALFATVLIAAVVWNFFAETQEGKRLGLIIFGVPAAISSYLLTAQRLRDLNLSGWFALLWIPLNMLDGSLARALSVAALIVLCAIPGTAGPNKYGDDCLVDGEKRETPG